MLQNEDFCNRHPGDVKIHTDETGRNTERNYELNFLVVQVKLKNL